DQVVHGAGCRQTPGVRATWGKVLRDKRSDGIIISRGSRGSAEHKLVRGITGTLIRLVHVIRPSPSCRHGDVGIKNVGGALPVQIFVIEWLSVIDVHELIPSRGGASEDLCVRLTAAIGHQRGSGRSIFRLERTMSVAEVEVGR